MTQGLYLSAGLVVGSVLLALRKPTRMKAQMVAAWFFMALLILPDMVDGKGVSLEPGTALIAASGIFALMTVLTVAKDLRPKIGESSLLLTCMVFWYLWAALSPGTLEPILIAAAAPPTALTVVMAMTARQWGFRVKLLGSGWFLFMSTGVALFLVPSIETSNPPDLFPMGVALPYVGLCVLFLCLLAPVWAIERLGVRKWWREYADSLVERSVDYGMKRGEAVFILVVPGTLLAANHHLRVASPGLVACLGIIVLPPLLALAFKRKRSGGGVRLPRPRTPDGEARPAGEPG